MQIQLPENVTDFVEQQVVLRGYQNPVDYVSDLIEADRRKLVRQQIEAEIIKGLESGPSTPFTKEDWESIRQEVISRHRMRTEKGST